MDQGTENIASAFILSCGRREVMKCYNAARVLNSESLQMFIVGVAYVTAYLPFFFDLKLSTERPAVFTE